MNILNIELNTKKDYIDLFNKVNMPLQPYYTESCTRIDYAHSGVGYGNHIAGMEGFSRVLWGAGPAIDLLDSIWLNLILTGIKNGTNPRHVGYWGDLKDYDQRMVEMPAIALALWHSDKFLWKKLLKAEQENAADWLRQIFDHECADGNWQFFKVLAGKVLIKLGYEVDEAAIREPLKKIDACYLGNGWYQDSSRGRQDYYNSFAFHYYGLLYSVLAPEDEYSQIFRERAKVHAKDFIHFFAQDGANVLFGRSMTYRYAAVAFWAALIYADVYPFELSVMKGIFNRNIKWWMEKDIFNENGILSIGCTYQQLPMSEPYNSGLSSYWSNKIFLILALADNHDFWKAEAAELPERPKHKLIEAANMLAVHDHGHTILLNAGQPGANYHALTSEKYLKFAYSSQFGFSIPRSNHLKEEAAMDSMLGVQYAKTKMLISRQRKTVEAVGQFMVRHRVSDVLQREDIIASTWKVSDDIQIRTWLTTVGGWQLRIHKVQSDSEIVLYETGFAVADAPENPGIVHKEKRSHYFCGDKGFSGIVDLSGESIHREQCPVSCLPNTNLMTWEKTCLPGLEVTLLKGTHWLLTGIYAHEDVVRALAAWEEPPVVRLENERIICKYKNMEKNFSKEG